MTVEDKDLVQSFINYFWVNTPSNWKIEFSTNKKYIDINIEIDSIGIIKRSFPVEGLKKIRGEVETIASECVKEIKNEIIKRKK